MNRDGTIRCEFQVELPRTDCPRLGTPLWGKASGVLSGRAEPQRAIAAFDATRQQPFETVAAYILQNVAGWATWAAGEMFRRWATDRDIAELVKTPGCCHAEFLAAVQPQFDPWGFRAEQIEVDFELAPEVLAALPEAVRGQLLPQDPNIRVVEHTFGGDIPPATDPATRNEIKVRCNVQVTFETNLEQARAALDVSGQMPQERLERELLGKCEEWFWYGVKQSFYNWIFDVSQPHRRFVRDYSLIHPKVMELCGPGLEQVGTTVGKAMVRYEALDSDSAWALTAPGTSGAGPLVAAGSAPPAGVPAAGADPTGSSGKHQAAPAHRPGSDQAMAATIAVMDINDLPIPGYTAGSSALPTIEESVWRHQKRVMKDKPGLNRAETAAEILMLLKADGYSFEDRKRIASIIGADPASVVD
ncbi:MAG: hypothetical protein ABI333_23655 [bacterium]